MKAYGVIVLSGDIEHPESKDIATAEADSLKSAFDAARDLASARPNWKLIGVCNGEDFPKIMEGLES